MTAIIEKLNAFVQNQSKRVQKNGYEFVYLHTYTDSDGKPVYWKFRAKHPETGEKYIRPISWIDGKFELKEPPEVAAAPRKMLYRLHDLHRNEQAPVIVTEGELKADRLAELGLCATSSGSATSAAKADWGPLRGCQVLIWPDNDEAGASYAEDVAHCLADLDCEVSIFDACQLGLPPKGDAVDWLAAHPGATADDILALPQKPEAPPDEDTAWSEASERTKVPMRPELTFTVGVSLFKLDAQGVWHSKSDDRELQRPPAFVCAPLQVKAQTRDGKSEEWGRLLSWTDNDGKPHLWPMPLPLLEGDGAEVRRVLAGKGLLIAQSKQAREQLAIYIKCAPTEERTRCVDRLGWHDEVYVLPSNYLGKAQEPHVFINSAALESTLSQKGSVAAWRTTVGALAAGNTRLMFALSVAFAGALLDIVQEDSGGFHLRGKSSSGKSTALKLAASVWGKPAETMRVWRATANGLEGLAALHNDNVLILDELGQCEPKQAGEAAYMLANGQGKTRANRQGEARASARWRVLFLSSGEVSLTSMMAEAGHRANAGQEIRLADLDADAGSGLGAFEDLHGHTSAAAFAQALIEAAQAHYGEVGMEWLRRLVHFRGKIAAAALQQIKDFVDTVTSSTSSGQAIRVARRFGLVAVAGELATGCGLTGWQKGESTRAAQACFHSWLQGFGEKGDREEREALAQVRAFMEQHGSSRFEDIDLTLPPHGPGPFPRVIDRAGFRRRKAGRQDQLEHLVLPEAFRREICRGLDVKFVEQALIKHGWLVIGGDQRPTQKQRIPGLSETTRVYVMPANAWSSYNPGDNGDAGDNGDNR